ncbi:predicted protein [Coccidioides posadasii str. Silveira]|uniref:Predicted protein n=2 Tax=Coccidioides posadasii TaxID=199306 RepID=E9CZ62_COCPS|nr:predicted protein [Coccidioides posadasii str. Silveira]KMM72926.1 hypothetical protein CPAG_09216 [Coccidioides posadasii RMSCC 3488]
MDRGALLAQCSHIPRVLLFSLRLIPGLENQRHQNSRCTCRKPVEVCCLRKALVVSIFSEGKGNSWPWIFPAEEHLTLTSHIELGAIIIEIRNLDNLRVFGLILANIVPRIQARDFVPHRRKEDRSPGCW